MSQGKLEVVKQEMAINILGVSELKRENSIQVSVISITVGKNPLEEME